MDAENPNASSPSADRDPQEGGYGSPSPEEEMPQEAAPGGAAQGARQKVKEQGSDTPAQDQTGAEAREEQPDGDLAEPEEAPSTDAPIDEGNAENHGHRESFSSESDADASGLPEGD